MSAHPPGRRKCAGQFSQCRDASVLTGGAAMHPVPVDCVRCHRAPHLARYVVDAHIVAGSPAPGHLCSRCDPWSPRNNKPVTGATP